MQWVTPKINELERPNLVCNTKEKTLEGKQKGGMTRQAKSQTLGLRFTQDVKCAWCKLKAMSKMMLKKEWSCNLFECCPFSTNYMKGGMHVITSRERIPTQTSNGFGRGMDQRYWHLSPSIKIGNGMIESSSDDRCNKCPTPWSGHKCNETMWKWKWPPQQEMGK